MKLQVQIEKVHTAFQNSDAI